MSAFFIASLFSCLSVSAQTNNLSLQCQSREFDQIVNITNVYDGDTVRTDTSEKIRLIGINTPETGKKEYPAQPLANEAKNALVALLAHSHNKVGLQFGKDKRDRYQRLLAHVFLPDGTNVQQYLLEQGLAAYIVVPPNTEKIGCYQNAERKARQQKKGMWSIPDYEYKNTNSLSATDAGFRFIEGNVIHVGQSKKAIWLNMEGKTALRISKDNLVDFGPHFPEKIVGKRVQARGWLHYNKKRKELFMHVRHPASMVIMEQLKN
ncbi:MAG: thermonuclease family protein [Gammaproteobacteria bacterium]|nr:thermonuclease family protein [Gammaproteobacteria bacterium]MDH5594688.1 thermonuclease family protein [Gammaproteobacteria bacterium]